VLDTAEFLSSAFAIRLLFGLKCEVVLHDAEASFQWLIVMVV
jgi:hypothetical protein